MEWQQQQKKPLERCSLSHSGSPRVLHLVCMTVASLTLVIMCISILLSRCQTLERRSQCHVHFTRILHKVGVWQMVLHLLIELINFIHQFIPWDYNQHRICYSLRWLVQRRQWHPTLELLPGKSHGRRSLVGCSPWGRTESDTTERLHFHFSLSCVGEGNGNPLQCSCLENPRDGRAWGAAICGVAQSQTQLKWLSSSSKVTGEIRWFLQRQNFIWLLNNYSSHWFHA